MTDKKHKWDDTQKRLLRECIDGKWKLLVEEPGQEEPKCNLCEIYQPDGADDDDQCDGCPVAAYTGERYCFGTPYYTFRDDAMRTPGYTAGLSDAQRTDELDSLRLLATAERDFLREVLEAGS